jgi:hypothetical protein
LVRRLLLIPGVLALMLTTLTAGCGNVKTETSSTTEYEEEFAGTVNPGAGEMHVFTVSQKGTITAHFSAIGDDGTRILGLAIGNYSGNACQIAVANDASAQDVYLAATVSASGTLCARAYDSQAVPDATTYTLTVKHP